MKQKKATSSDQPEIPDATIDALLADEEARAAIAAMLKAADIETPLDEVPRDLLKTVVAAMMNASQQQG